MFDLIAGFLSFLVDGFTGSDPGPERRTYAAYKSAWKAGWKAHLPLEQRDDRLLIEALKAHHVPGAYDAPGPPHLDAWFESWSSALTPRNAKSLAKSRRTQRSN